MDLLAYRAWRGTLPGPAKDKLLTKLMVDNDRLVRRLADKFLSRLNVDSAAMREDVLQAGRLALFRAFHTFKPARGSFSTCVGNWARLEMQRVMAHNAPISFPRGLLFASPNSRYTTKCTPFSAVHGREPTERELSGLDDVKVAEFVSVSKAEHIPETVRDGAVDTAAEEAHDRDLDLVRTFLGGLTKEQRAGLQAGSQKSLARRLKALVEARRST